jgi:hypothetical protein
MPKLFLRKLFSKISKTNNDPPKSINFKSDKIVADFKNSMNKRLIA